MLDAGIPWNTLDEGKYTAGDYAEQGEHKDAYDALVDAGVRAEIDPSASWKGSAE